MDIREFEYMVAVAEFGSFSHAAESLYVAQSSLSRKIRMIEEEFGTRLFIRTYHGIELTSAGKVFYGCAKDILAGFERLRSSMALERSGENCLHLAYTTCNVAPAILSLTRRMREAHPGIRILIHSDGFIMRSHHVSTPVLEPLVKQYCDAVFTFLPVAESAAGNWMKYRSVVPGGLCACVSAEHRLAPRASVPSAALHDEALLLPPTYFSPVLSDAIRSALGGPPNVSHCDDAEDFRLEILSGRSVGIVPFAAHGIGNESIRCIPVTDVTSGFDLVMAWNGENRNPALGLFLETCP